ncbi:MCP four helix bundle domain-containing protein [bacterium]|nr:MCP four helix bundle domain-containing protein [bacterium]
MRLKIGTKLLSGFGIILALTAIVGLASLAKLNAVNDLLIDMYERQAMGLSVIKEANLNLIYLDRSEKNAILSDDATDIEKRITRSDTYLSRLKELLTQYRSLIVTDEARRIQSETVELVRELEPYLSQAHTLTRANRDAEATQLGLKMRPIVDRIDDNMTELAKRKERLAEKARDDAAKTFAEAKFLVIALLLVAIALGTGIALFISRQLSKGLTAVAHAAEGIAHGDLDQRLDIKSNDELGDMAQSFRAMIENLRQVIGGVRASAQSVAAGSDQISSGAEELSKTSQAQAAATEQTSSSMEEIAANIQQVAGNAQTLSDNVASTSSSIEEMAASVQQVAGNADDLASAVAETSASIEEMTQSIQQVAVRVSEANQEANEANRLAQSGAQSVQQTVTGMTQIQQTMHEVLHVIEELGKSSSEIGNIIEVIDDIAEQTNLLALNAAIEAARAGEHGRGFAVVADEVRKLAERSARATGEIASLIKGIQHETAQAIASTKQGDEAIQTGSRLAATAGDSLEAIVASIGRVGAHMTHITQATQEQSHAAGQISLAVGNMSTLTDQTAIATREQANASQQIMRSVEAMNRMTLQVSNATVEQRKGGDMILRAVEDISSSTQESVSATSQIAQAAGDLQSQAQQLLDAIAFFKDGQAEQPRTARTAIAPPAQATRLIAQGR